MHNYRALRNLSSRTRMQNNKSSTNYSDALCLFNNTEAFVRLLCNLSNDMATTRQVVGCKPTGLGCNKYSTKSTHKLVLKSVSKSVYGARFPRGKKKNLCLGPQARPQKLPSESGAEPVLTLSPNL